ncbi:TonB-dependent receptor [Sphingosinicella sp. BN140058]|uniref:TonB-dependent receptor n=1 Tax=Sphingosinicella sp. BN140058 TaxID=1892855 RepID=UPI0013EE29C6|nr:TonB-dependent receptor [Sphingosinicella sp. BN140058]
MRHSSGCLVSALAALAAAPLHAETGETADGEIIVTATRAGSPIEQLPISVSIADEDAIVEQLRQNRNLLSGLEAVVPGLNIQPSETRGSCLTRVRGRAVSFQLNGVPINEDLRQGSCTGPFTISPFALERVEVVRGGTALYGAGAPGGIINLITKRGRTDDLAVDLTAQTSFNTERADDTWTTDVYAGAGQRSGAFDYYVATAYTDGGRIRDAVGDPLLSGAYEAIDLLGSFGLALPGGSELRWITTFHHEDVGRQFYPSGMLIPGTDLAEVIEVAPNPQVGQGRDRDVTTTLGYSHPDLLGHALTLSLFYQHQSIKQRDNFFDAATGDSFFSSNRRNERFGIRSAAVRDYALGDGVALKTSYGFDYTRNALYRFVVDENETVTSALSPEIVLRTYAPFAQAELSVGAVTLTGGARHEWYRGEITAHAFRPDLPGRGTPGDIGKSALTLFNLGAVYRITPDIQLYGGFSQGAELSQLGRAARNIRNPATLTPEPATSDQYEIGVRGSVGPVRFGAAAYHSESKSAALLQADPSCAGVTPICPLIPLRSPQRFHGVEAELGWKVDQALELSGILTLQRGKVFDDDLDRYINYATDVVVPLRITARADWTPTDEIGIGLQVSHYGASSFFSPAEEGLGLVDTDAVTLVSASARYGIGPAEIYVAADNLLDETYISPNNQAAGSGSFAYYRGAGRRITLGVAARF